jgi:hypothetical protein
LFGLLDVESRMLHQLAHALRGPGQARGGLHLQPLVYHQRFVLPLLMEGGQRRVALGQVEVGQRAQRGHDVRHVAGAVELCDQARHDAGLEMGRLAFGEVGETEVAQGAAADLCAFGCVGFGRRQRLPHGLEFVAQRRREMAAQGHARGMDGLGVDDFAAPRHLFGQHLLGREHQGFGGERGILRESVVEHPADSGDIGCGYPIGAGDARGDAGEQHVERRVAARLPSD